MLPALIATVAVSWVPMRWNSTDARTLELIRGSPINCLIMEKTSAEFVSAAASHQIAVLLAARAGADLEEALSRVSSTGAAGLVLEGPFGDAEIERARRILEQSGRTLVELPPRARLRLDRTPVIVGTTQGLWPGIRVLADGAVRAAPTGSPWVETNTGFLRYVRAATRAPVWIANAPPENASPPIEAYLAAIADAAITGARWVVSLDPTFERRLFAGETNALRGWKRIIAHLKFYEDHSEWRSWKPCGQLALVMDETSGALLANGVVDMIAVRHVPLRVVPRNRLNDEALAGAKLVVNVDPAALGEVEKQALRNFTRSGGTLLSGPPGWKFAPPGLERITLEEKEVERLGEIWREVNTLLGRRNLGVRLFNVAGMLSNLLASPDGKQVLLHLANFTSYPAENITAQFSGPYARALLLTPEEPPRQLPLRGIEGGVEVEIERVLTSAALLLDCKR